jgi:Raf kinase inhibitor-like YbhB/YbcL family protein
MQLTSPQFTNQEMIPALYTCKGENISPPLTVEEAPKNTVSLALLMHDPDAVGKDFLHWAIWNISPETTEIDENATPAGAVLGMNSRKKNTYIGPCPPINTGTHRYIFDLFALDTSLDLPEDAARITVESVIATHTIEQATLIGLFIKE